MLLTSYTFMTSLLRLFCPVIGFSISCPDTAAVSGVSIVASVQLRLGEGKNLLIIDWRPGAWHPAAGHVDLYTTMQ